MVRLRWIGHIFRLLKNSPDIGITLEEAGRDTNRSRGRMINTFNVWNQAQKNSRRQEAMERSD